MTIHISENIEYIYIRIKYFKWKSTTLLSMHIQVKWCKIAFWIQLVRLNISIRLYQLGKVTTSDGRYKHDEDYKLMYYQR